MLRSSVNDSIVCPMYSLSTMMRNEDPASGQAANLFSVNTPESGAFVVRLSRDTPSLGSADSQCADWFGLKWRVQSGRHLSALTSSGNERFDPRSLRCATVSVVGARTDISAHVSEKLLVGGSPSQIDVSPKHGLVQEWRSLSGAEKLEVSALGVAIVLLLWSLCLFAVYAAV